MFCDDQQFICRMHPSFRRKKHCIAEAGEAPVSFAYFWKPIASEKPSLSSLYDERAPGVDMKENRGMQNLVGFLWIVLRCLYDFRV